VTVNLDIARIHLAPVVTEGLIAPLPFEFHAG
jgi:hypothetical protein